MHQLLVSSFVVANLDCTSRHHLLPQMILVFSNAAIPSTDCLVLAHQNILGNLVEQSGDALALFGIG